MVMRKISINKKINLFFLKENIVKRLLIVEVRI